MAQFCAAVVSVLLVARLYLRLKGKNNAELIFENAVAPVRIAPSFTNTSEQIGMNWADWVIVAILVVSSLISLKRGFVKEALSMVNWVLAFIIAMTFGEQLSSLLVDHISTPSVRDMVAFALLFAATLIVGALVSYLIGELVRLTGLSGTDRLFGMIFGLVRGFIVVMAILLIVPGIIPIDQDTWWKESVIIPHLMEFEGWCRVIASEFTTAVSSRLNG